MKVFQHAGFREKIALRFLAIAGCIWLAAALPVAAQEIDYEEFCYKLAMNHKHEADWDFIVINSTASYMMGEGFKEHDILAPAAGDIVQLCSRRGLFLIISGPSKTVLMLEGEELDTRAGAIPDARDGAISVEPRNPPPTSRPSGNPPYPVWPPEAPSSRASLDRFIAKRAGLSLYDAGQRLIASFEDAGYLEHSFYSAPGGFVLVTRIEKIAEDGSAFKGVERYRMPNQRSEPSMTEYIRGLFLEAPPGFYRYIAVVVSNQPYQTSSRALSDAQASRRLRDGSNDLDRSYYSSLDFSEDFKVDALIYEFRKDATSAKARMIDPGRLPPQTHLARTKLDSAIRKRFAR